MKNTIRYNLPLKLGIITLSIASILGFLLLGFTFGIKFFMAVGLILVLLGVVNNLYLRMENGKIIKIIRYVLLAVVTLWIISFIIVQLAIIYNSRADNINVNYIIVLGAGLNKNEPSFILSQRLDVAVEYSGNNPDATIIVSGGQGQGDSISEAEAMKTYLIKKGVDKSKIIKEDKSTNTRENIINTKAIIDNMIGDGNHIVLIITSEYHLFRAKYIARQYGYNSYGLPSNTPILIRVNYSIQEYFSILKMFIWDQMT